MPHRILIAIAILALLPACGSLVPQLSDEERLERIEAMYETYRDDFPTVDSISPADADRLRQLGQALMVDVRDPVEQSVSIIPGAMTEEVYRINPEAHPAPIVVAYCTIGARSGAFARELQAQGKRVFNLRGGLLAWTHAGLPLVDANGQGTPQLHVYGPKWNLAATGITPFWGDPPKPH